MTKNYGYGFETARLMKEDGTYVNMAGLYENLELSTSTMASRKGTMYRTFFSGTNLAAGEYTFVLDIPEGINLIGFTRSTSISGGSCTSEFVVASEFTLDSFSRKGNNFNETLNLESQSTLRRVLSFTGDARTPAIPIIAPGDGVNRKLSTQTETGILTVFDHEHIPAFRYVLNTETSYFAIEISWQELPKEE